MERDRTSLIGKRFNRWTVLGFGKVGVSGDSYWSCRCDCGTERFVLGSAMLNGTSKSCGCWNVEARFLKNKYNCKNNRLYSIFKCMKNRCYRANREDYRFYGGRGISICEEWLKSFSSFYSWAMSNGYSDDLSIDRIDTNGNYEPSNCRWVDAKTQSNNQRSNRIINYHGENYTMAQLSRKLGIKYTKLRYHLDRNNDIDLLLSGAKHE